MSDSDSYERLMRPVTVILVLAAVFSIAVGLGTALAIVIALEILASSGILEVLEAHS